jgi:hypothetical protein
MLAYAVGAIAAAAVTWEIIDTLMWVIVVTAVTAPAIAVTAAVVIARRMNRPVQLTQYRPAPALGYSPPLTEIEARLRAAEIDARAALLAARLLAHTDRPQSLSGQHSPPMEVSPDD